MCLLTLRTLLDMGYQVRIGHICDNLPWYQLSCQIDCECACSRCARCWTWGTR
jgi:hypothetical protein